MINKLKEAEKFLPELIMMPDLWNTLNVDYFPPKVERLWMQYDKEHRLFIHVIHPTDEYCLFHKHRWEGAFKMLRGSYEMGLSMSEKEVTNEEAHALPVVAKFIIAPGTYYEMTYTHGLHYVRPIGEPSLSLMMTGNLYPEVRTDSLDRDLQPLSDQRKREILLDIFIELNEKRK